MKFIRQPNRLGRLAWLVIGLALTSFSLRAEEVASQFLAADRELNQSYQSALQGMPPRDVGLLREAGRKWIALRDANVQATAMMFNADAQQAAVKQKTRDTLQRVEFLKTLHDSSLHGPEDPDRSALQQVDQQLNVGYQALLASLPDGQTKEAIRKSQRAWLAARDADIALLVGIGVARRDGSRWAFWRRVTARRAEFLREVQGGVLNVSKNLPATLPARPKTLPVAPAPSVPFTIGYQLPSKTISQPLRRSSVDAPGTKEPLPQIDAGDSSSGIVLDMRENLLVQLRGRAVEFWDAQTGALIQSVTVSTLDEEIDFQTDDVENLGGGQVAVTVSFNRNRNRLFRIYDRASSSPLISIPEPSQWATSEESGKFAILSDPPAADDQWAGPQLLVGMWGDKLLEFTIPAVSGQPWKFLAIARDGKNAAVGTASRIIVISLPEGKVVSDVEAPAAAEFTDLVTDGSSLGFVGATKSGALLRLVPGASALASTGALPVGVGKKINFGLTSTKPGWLCAGFGDDKPQIVASSDAPEGIRKLFPALIGRPWALDWGGEYAAATNVSGAIDLYHVPSGMLVRTFGVPKAGQLLHLAPDGKSLLCCQKMSDGRIKVSSLNIDKLARHSFVVDGFDQIVGSDRSGEYLFVFRETGDKLSNGLSSSPWLTGGPGSRQELGVINLRTGELAFQGLDPATKNWLFSPASGVLVGLDEDPDSKKVVLCDPLESADRQIRRFDLSQILPSRFQISSTSLSVSSDRRKLCFLSASRDRLMAVDISKPGKPSLARGYSLTPVECRTANTLISHDGNCLAVIFVKGKLTEQVDMYDTRVPGKRLWSRDFRIVDAPAFTADSRFFMFGERRGSWETGVPLHLLDVTSGRAVSMVNLEAEPGVHNTLVAQDASRALVKSGTGGYHIVDIRGDRLVQNARFVPGTGEDYALVLRDGYYLTVGDAHRLISFSRGGRSQPAESLDIKYNRPDLVAASFGAPPQLVQAFRRAYEKRLARMGIGPGDLAGNLRPPTTTVDHRQVPLTAESRTVKIPVDVKPGGAPLVALEATVNDVPILGRNGRLLSGAEANGYAGEIEIELAAGRNKISVWARDARGLTSSRVSVDVTSTAKPPQKRSLFVVTVGINEYVGNIPRLTLAKKDAMDIGEFFSSTAASVFTVKVKSLLDQKATRSAILEMRRFLAEAGVEDQVVIFMSAHGVLDADFEYRFCSADTDLDRLPETTLTFSEIESLFDDCKARRRIVMLDTCHAGEPDRDDPLLADVVVSSNAGVKSIPFKPVIATGVSAGALRITDLLEQYFVDLRIGSGAAVLSSSTAQQKSLEAPEVNNGLFTAAVLSGLRANTRRADLNRDGAVRVSELLRFCREEVRRLSDGLQEPVSRHTNLSEDFEVVRYP